MAEILNNESIVLIIMGVVAFLVTQGLKWLCIKPFTKDLDKRKKTIINSIILLIAFGSAVLCEFLYSHFWLKAPLDLMRASYGWGYASGVYGVFEMVIKFINGEPVKLDNLYESEIGKQTTELVNNIVKDNKVDVKDSKEIKDFVSRLNQIK